MGRLLPLSSLDAALTLSEVTQVVDVPPRVEQAVSKGLSRRRAVQPSLRPAMRAIPPEAPQGGAGAPRDAVIIPPLTRTTYSWVNSSGISAGLFPLAPPGSHFTPTWRQQLNFLDPG